MRDKRVRENESRLYFHKNDMSGYFAKIYAFWGHSKKNQCIKAKTKQNKKKKKKKKKKRRVLMANSTV